MAVAGLVCFGFALEGLRFKRSLNLVGFVASGMCLFSLILSLSGTGVFLYFLGLTLIVIVQFLRHKSAFYLSFGVPLLSLTFIAAFVSGERSLERVLSFLRTPAEVFSDGRMDVFRDTWRMVLDAPLSGVGIGNFAAVFPQYMDASTSPKTVLHPDSDVLWLLSEGGALAVICLAVLLYNFFRISVFKRRGKGVSYRTALYVALFVFGLHSLVDVSAHRPGTVYFALFIAALLVPLDRTQPSSLKPMWWRVFGFGLSFVGILWIGSYVYGWGVHSSVRCEWWQGMLTSGGASTCVSGLLNRQIKQQPMDWSSTLVVHSLSWLT